MPLRILVVDDDTGVRLATSALLGELGHQVEVAESGEQAVERAEPGQFDVLILDLHLPGINGFETLRQCRMADPAIKSIIVSGSLVEDRPTPPPGCEPDAWQTKPMQFDAFRTTLGEFDGR